MNCVDVKKKVRSVEFWREDLLKYAEHGKGPSTAEFLRELFHREMEPVQLSRKGCAELKRQIEEALEKRKVKAMMKSSTRKAKAKSKTPCYGEPMPIPARVRRHCSFKRG